MAIKIIPANPGWYVAELIRDERNHAVKFDKEIIIAWVIETTKCADGSFTHRAHPITEDYSYNRRDFSSHGDSVLLIQRPDGHFVVPGEGPSSIPPNDDEAIKYFENKRKYKKNKKKEK